MSHVRPDEAVVVLGSGLTAVDAVLSLTEQPRSAGITLVSLSGLLPQAHAATPIPPADLQSLVSKLIRASSSVHARTLLRELRRAAKVLGAQGLDWRSVIDGLRPHTARLWQAMPPAERRRFLRHLRPIWEVHRHRMAISVAERFRALLKRGEVCMIPGRMVSARAAKDEIEAVVRLRGSDRQVKLSAGWVINCTGPLPSNSPESNLVIGSLLADGWLCVDELALGVLTTSAGNAITTNGQIVPDMFIVGTLCKPASWESTAVPELRDQAATVAGRALEHLTFRSKTSASSQETLSFLHSAARPISAAE